MWFYMVSKFRFFIAGKITLAQKTCFIYSRLSADADRLKKKEKPWRCELSHTSQSILHKFRPQPLYKLTVPFARPGQNLLYLKHTTFFSQLRLHQYCLLQSWVSSARQPRERYLANEEARCCSQLLSYYSSSKLG